MDQLTSRFGTERNALLGRLFPDGFPTLWCPLVTHYDDDGGIDRGRMRAQLRHLAPHVGGFLLPGSTGDGWDMDEQESRQLVAIALEEVAAIGRKLLIGALRFETAAVLRSIDDSLGSIAGAFGATLTDQAAVASPVCGFTVCAPRGSELSQHRIRAGLEAVLELGVPVSLYQLPQVTQNEIAPQTVAALAAKYPNFYLFKDTSGGDRVATSGVREVLLLRGAEGDYAGQLALGGGAYDGFLLSAANGLARELRQIRSELEQGNTGAAQALSGAVSAAVEEAFALAQPLPHGNAFANANKAIDHFFAYGARALDAPAPRLRGGQRLPQHFVTAVGEALARRGLRPANGYLV
jgi:dihydrodipicolinate synthase/N-acetylneuraminate lyase